MTTIHNRSIYKSKHRQINTFRWATLRGKYFFVSDGLTSKYSYHLSIHGIVYKCKPLSYIEPVNENKTITLYSIHSDLLNFPVSEHTQTDSFYSSMVEMKILFNLNKYDIAMKLDSGRYTFLNKNSIGYWM